MTRNDSSVYQWSSGVYQYGGHLDHHHGREGHLTLFDVDTSVAFRLREEEEEDVEDDAS